MLYFYTLTTKDQKEKLNNYISIASKRIKSLGINLPKVTKDLYPQSYKMLMKEIEDDTDGKIYHVLRLKESVL